MSGAAGASRLVPSRRPTWLRVLASVALLGVGAGVAPPKAEGQAYRAWLRTSVNMVELRPVAVDSVALVAAVADGAGGFVFEGHPVRCGTEVCTGLLPQSKDRTFATSQDAGFTYWDLGVQGLSVTGLVRFRSDLGGDAAWPRFDDEFDAMLGYAQLVRSSWRVRAGRQEVRSGLGFSAFDGLSMAYDRRSVRGEVYGGRSLARGVREPSNEVARALDDFFVDQGVYLFGGAATVRAMGIALTGRYQRELLADRSGLESERASVDVSAVVPRVRITGSLDYDFAFERVGKGDLTLSAPFDGGTWLVELSGRRYVPYFQLSTIWGFFEPVSYSEGRLRLAWSGSRTLGLWAAGGVRSYGDTDTPVVLSALEDTGWRGDAGFRWEPAAEWSVDGRYQLEWGSGAFLSSGDVSTRFQATERLGVGATFVTFQQIEEFRLGEGRAVGFGGTADYAVDERIDLFGGVSVTRHRDGGTVFTSPWNQTRAWTSVRISLGRDPGLANRGARR